MEGAVVPGEGGGLDAPDVAERLCPQCGEPVAPLQTVCAACGAPCEPEADDDDHLTEADRTSELLADGADWSSVGWRLVLYTALIALAVIALAVSLLPWIFSLIYAPPKQ